MATGEKIINLALQGGGAHGAYTWGVLDRLLEDDRISIEGISGTSAGAMNAAILVDGFAQGKYDGARRALEEFWHRISELGQFSILQQTPWERLVNGWNLDASPMYTIVDLLSRVVSPYDLNPMNLNPMRAVLDEMLDIKRLHAHEGIKLFIAATSVRTGRSRIFHCHQVTVDALMASACLPFIYQAVEIEGEAYWDGGYSGNPAIWPLIYHCNSNDVMLVQINPFVRDEVPHKASEIIDRMNEIGFNSALVGELRAIEFVRKLLAHDNVSHAQYKNLRMHMIFSPKELHDLNASSKLNTSWDFFRYLRDIGRKAADSWLESNYDNLGTKATFDFDQVFELKKEPAILAGAA